MGIHESYIKRCIQIAKNGLGNTRPNPMVGAVIVHNNTIIGEGYTSTYGGYHAEVNAINAVSNKTLLKDATLYVTLEPCSHFGNTPPCSDFIIKHNIPNIVIGCIDDNPKVAGNGIKQLKDAKRKVTVGVLEYECKTHHKRFFTYHNKKRPYVILKWAESTDGFLSPKDRTENSPIWITNTFSRQLVHKWRSEEHAILVGTTTVRDDNPRLTVRDWSGQHPIRVVINKGLTLPQTHYVFDATAETIIINEHINWNTTNTIAQQICNLLYQNNIQSVIIEGGAKTLQTFINENVWDEARIFKNRTTFKNGTKAPILHGVPISETSILNDTLTLYKNE